MDTLGDRLLFLRTNLGLTAREVMEQVNINDLGRFEKNERKPSLETLLALAKYYNVTTDWLITGVGDLQRDRYNELQRDEKHLLDNYRDMNDQQKRDFMNKSAVILEAGRHKKLSTSRSSLNDEATTLDKNNVG